ncbi:MAG: MFS transporter [Ardenticatenaceae bacterium]|nr:MFS transporter [Ardenticatenaceae bacterium]
MASNPLQSFQKLSRPVWQLLISVFFAGMGLRLQWLFLNFHLEDIGFTRDLIGYANAVPAVSMIILGIPAGIMAPRIGYVVSLRSAAWLAAGGLLLIGWAPSTAVVFVGLFIFGLGNSLIMATTPALLQKIAPPAQRVTAFSYYGALGTAAGFVGNVFGGYLPDLLGGLNRVIFLMAVVFALSTIPLSWLKRERSEGVSSFKMHNPRLWVRLLIPNTIVSLGAGLVMPFLNLYLAEKFSLSFEWIGFLFGISALATSITILIQPFLVEKMGKVGAIATSQGAALPFILILAYVPFLPLVTVALFVRESLMNAANPIYQALSMQLLHEDEAAAFMITYNAFWRIGWAISSSISGEIQAALGLEAFNYLFAAMFLLYGTAISLLLIFFWRSRWQIEAAAMETAG